MHRLENLSVGHRIAITFIIVLVILLGLALYGYLTGAWENEEHETTSRLGFGLASAETRPVNPLPTDLCMDDDMREKVRAIMLQAFDDALREHLHRMYDVWMKDESGQPERAARGARQGVSAYIRARAGAQKWNPPACPG